MKSARERRPATGRTNLTEKYEDRRPATSSEKERRAKWNDPLMFHRPFSPRDPFVPEVQSLPPILPPSVYPTVPPPDTPKRRIRPSVCPKDWEERLQKPELFDRSNMKGYFEDDEKFKYCREFIERNRSELWKFDHTYAKKTPRALCNSIVHDPNYISIMVRNHIKEKTLRLNSSNAARQCLRHGDYNRDTIDDPFIASLTTAREIRDKKRLTLIDGAFVNTIHRRGYAHAPEYGNFSRYNGVLKNNSATVIKR